MSVEERASENDAQNESTFSAGSMFGMLLTLSICLLLQPQGNFIFQRPQKMFGRALFFFLRLHPYLCAFEAASVLHALALILRRAIKVCHGNPYREFGVFAADLRAGAAGLLLLRNHTTLGWDTNSQLDEEFVVPASKRGGTEMVLGVISLLSMAGTVVKLIASVIPWHFQVISWCYIGSWIVIQLAVMMSHCGPSRELLDRGTLLRSVEHLQQRDEFLKAAGPMALVEIMLLLVVYGVFFLNKGGLGYHLALYASAFCVLGLMQDTWLFRSEDRREVLPILAFLVAPLAAIATIAAALLHYEEEGTFKPEWLDWLG